MANLDPIDLPIFILQPNQMTYQEELSQTLRQWLSSEGWQMPCITTAQTATLEPMMIVGTFWFNTDLAKMQLKTADGVIETVTSV